MSTEAIVPSAPAAPPPAAPSAPPAATSSAPSTPSAPASTGAPVKTTPKREDFGSGQEFVQAVLDQRRAEREAAAETRTEPQAPPAVEEPPAPAEVKPDAGAQPPEAVVPDGEQPVEAKTTEAEKAPEEAPEGLDLQGGMTAKEIADKLKANPELQKLVESDPVLKGAIFRNARLAEKAAPYEEIFGADGVEGAKAAARSAATFADVDRLFLSATSPEGVASFMDRWAEMAMYVDDQGNRVMENGRPKMHPAFHNLIDQIALDRLNFLHRTATTNQDAELQAALDVLKARITGPASPSEDELPEPVKLKAAEIQRREEALNRQEREQQARERQQFDTTTADRLTTQIHSLVDKAIGTADLPEFVREAARGKILAEIEDNLANNQFFRSRLADYYALGPTPDALKRIEVLTSSQVNGVAGPIIKGILAKAGASTIPKVQEKKEKVAAQAQATQRTEPRATVGPARSTPPAQTPQAMLDAARKELRTELGDEPSMQQVIERFARIKKGQR